MDESEYGLLQEYRTCAGNERGSGVAVAEGTAVGEAVLNSSGIGLAGWEAYKMTSKSKIAIAAINR